MSIVELVQRAAEDHGAESAVIVDDESIDYAELWHRVLSTAEWLRSSGLGGGQRVAVIADNSAEYVVIYVAILAAGGTSAELNPELGDNELADQISAIDPAALIAHGRHRDRLSQLGLSSRSGDHLAISAPVGSDLSGSARELEHAIRGESSYDPDFDARVEPDAVATIVQTSGTTGRTKGVCLSHANLAWTVCAIAKSLSLESRSERFSGNLPLYYTYGKSVLHLAFLLAAPIVFTRKMLTPRALLRSIDMQRVTHLSAVPYLCSMLMRSDDFDAGTLPSLRRITVAGGALAADALTEMTRRFPDKVIPMYGLTEASTRVSCMPADEIDVRPRSCGRVLSGIDVRVVDEDGRALVSGERGELQIRGPNVMQGYFRDPAATAEVIVGDGWLRTGDLAFIDEERFLHVCGRLKDIVKVLGESISASTVEDAICAIPGVTEAAVTGRPDPQQGEALCAFVVRKSSESPDADIVRRHCALQLGRARSPTDVHFVDELPKTASGKVRKHLLRTELETIATE